MATYNKNYNTWKSHPAEMIKKVAEVHALKKAFGISMLQAEEDFEIRNDKAMPLGTGVASPSLQDAQVVEVAGEVYEATVKELEDAKTEFAINQVKKNFEKRKALNLLSPEAITELSSKIEGKLLELTKHE